MAHKILVIDDDKLTVTLLKFGLSEARYDVVFAHDGDEGIEKLKEENPDLVILDIQMPKMSGYEFMAELKTLDDIEIPPVIVLTANETMEDIFRMEGVWDYYIKPVDISRMIGKIKACLGPNPLD